jgi:acyl-CoA synthetase (AMP-forming)/AMP-acid ligase II
MTRNIFVPTVYRTVPRIHDSAPSSRTPGDLRLEVTKTLRLFRADPQLQHLAVAAEALRQHCIGLAAKHKAPRYVWLLDEPLPRNASGKFLKRELRDRLRLEEAA